MLDPLPRRQRPEAGTQVAAPQAAAAPSVLPDLAADAGRLPTVEAIEEEALRVAVEEAQRLNAADGAACAEATQAAKEATGKRQQEDGERRRRSKVVQNIALCEKLGIPYRTTGAACVPRRQKRLKKPCARVVPAAPAAAPASAPDSLQAMAEENARLLSRVGWRRLAKKRRGRSALSDEVGSLPHEAAGYLDYLRQLGAPVHSSAPPKSPDDLQAAVDRGPHPSAVEHQEFLWEESLEMCKRRHTMVLPFSAVKHLRGVQVSPPGVVPQANRRPRTIADLTFWGVNEATVDLTHKEAMQFGRALRRILFQIYRADPRWGPVYLAKVDISDGFYNVCVNANGAKNFGIVLPSAPGQEPLILFFLGLPMGWVSSPPIFSAATESVADVANAKIAKNWKPPPHRQDDVADTPTPSTRPPSAKGKPPRIKHRGKGPLGKTDVYVDDFILLAQGG